MPRKIECTTFFDHYLDFSMALDKFKGALTPFATSLLVFSYLHPFEMHAKAHNKLLRALTVTELIVRVLRGKEWLMLLKPLWHSLGAISTRPGIIVLTLPLLFLFFIFSLLVFV